MDITSDNIDMTGILSYLQKIDKKISNLEYDLNDLKERMHEDDSPSLSTAAVDQSQLDIEEKNFDKAWFMKHYRVDCPEFDQPLTLKAFQEIGYEMTPEQYGKYISEFYKKEEEPKTLDKVINDIRSAKVEEL